MFGPKFASSVGVLLHGKEDKRLRTWADDQRQSLGEQSVERINQLIRNLGAEQYQKRKSASKELLELAPRATAILGETLVETGDPEVRHRIGEMFSQLFITASEEKPGLRLPYGVQWAAGGGGCGGHCGIAEERQEIVVECGMAVAPAASRKFLRFVAKARQ